MSKFEFGWKSANLRQNTAGDVARGVWSLPSAKMNRVKGAHYAGNEWLAGVQKKTSISLLKDLLLIMKFSQQSS